METKIMFAAAMKLKGSNRLDNFVVYSDDNGESWKVSKMAYQGGDEAKLMELVNGDVLISVRQSGARGYNRSSSGGVSWGVQGRWESMTTNACNGDMVVGTTGGNAVSLLVGNGTTVEVNANKWLRFNYNIKARLHERYCHASGFTRDH